MRKLGFTALALGAALTLSLGLSVPQASAADGDNTDSKTTTETSTIGADNDAFSIDWVDNDTLELEAATGTKEILVGTAKAKGKSGEKVLSVSTWDTYVVGTNGYVDVDLSKLAITKDNIICIKADAQTDDEALNVVIPASVTKLKVAYDKTKGSLTFTENKNNYTGDVIYRTANSGYECNELTIKDGVIATNAPSSDKTDASETEETVETTDETANNETADAGTTPEKTVDKGYPTLDLTPYQMSGATLYFAVPSTSGNTTGVLKVGTETIHASNGKTALNAITVPARQGKEAKVTIGKLANAPKVSVNYKTGVITVPSKAQYRIIKKSATELGKFSETLTAKKALTIAKDTTDDLDATEAFAIDVKTVADGKLDSKIGHYTFKAQEATSATDVTKTSEVANSRGGANITLKNISENYAYKVTYTGYGKSATSTVTINKNTTAKTITKVATASGITVERVGDSKTQTWPGTVIQLGGGTVNNDTNNTDDDKNKTENVQTAFKIDYSTVSSDVVSVKDDAGNALDASAVEAGTTVVITTSLKSDSWYVHGVAEEATWDKTAKTYTFVMPSADVTINTEEE